MEPGIDELVDEYVVVIERYVVQSLTPWVIWNCSVDRVM